MYVLSNLKTFLLLFFLTMVPVCVCSSGDYLPALVSTALRPSSLSFKAIRWGGEGQGVRMGVTEEKSKAGEAEAEEGGVLTVR